MKHNACQSLASGGHISTPRIAAHVPGGIEIYQLESGQEQERALWQAHAVVQAVLPLEPYRSAHALVLKVSVLGKYVV